MIKRLIRRWLGVEPVETYPEVDRTYAEKNYASSVLSESTPAVVAHKIDNGYIVRMIDRTVISATMTMPTITYCKDHQEIADCIVANFTKTKLEGKTPHQLSFPFNERTDVSVSASGLVRSAKY